MSRIANMGCTGGTNRIASMNSVRGGQSGLTLVEMMVAMVLGLLILLAVSSIYIGSRQTFRLQDDNARLQETGRYALEVMGRSIRQAGFWNMPISPVATATAFQPLAGGAVITGLNGASGAPDTVTVQYDGLTGDRDCEGNALGANAVVQDAYRLNNNELQCDGNADGTVDHQALVSDIEDVQILYGIDTTADQSADQYVATPANWAQVVSARVCVQARSPNSVNNAPQRFLNCGGALGTLTGGAAFTTAGAGDLRLRRTFIATYNLRNRVTNVP
jgi:type IV pilus assembly protein PilW